MIFFVRFWQDLKFFDKIRLLFIFLAILIILINEILDYENIYNIDKFCPDGQIVIKEKVILCLKK